MSTITRMSELKWQCTAHDSAIQRSSHVLSVIGHKAYIFGGELIPRQPRDGKTIVVDMSTSTNGMSSNRSVRTLHNTIDPSVNETSNKDESPAARVGSASTTLASKLYMFSGRGGPSMSPTDESGGLWCFDPHQSTWSLIKPSDPFGPCPAARSYHCMTSDGVDNIYVHAGCPEAGRLADLWSFSISKRVWTQLTDAPGPSRGGTSIAYSKGKLYRMNGFDGKHEQGGALDVYDIERDEWTSKQFAADGKAGPEARSVSTLLPVEVEGRPTLVTLFGERDPSNLGHAGAGKMLGDVWLYDIDGGSWRKGLAKSDAVPPARGWFDADVLAGSKVVVAGGLSETNERLEDMWILSF